MEVILVIRFVFLDFPKKAHAIHFELARVVSFVFVNRWFRLTWGGMVGWKGQEGLTKTVYRYVEYHE